MLALGRLVTHLLTGSRLGAADLAVVAWPAEHRTDPLDTASTIATNLCSTTNVILIGPVAAAVAGVVLRRWWRSSRSPSHCPRGGGAGRLVVIVFRRCCRPAQGSSAGRLVTGMPGESANHGRAGEPHSPGLPVGNGCPAPAPSYYNLCSRSLSVRFRFGIHRRASDSRR